MYYGLMYSVGIFTGFQRPLTVSCPTLTTCICLPLGLGKETVKQCMVYCLCAQCTHCINHLLGHLDKPNRMNNSRHYVTINMPQSARTGPKSGRCWQHRADSGPVLAYCGMLIRSGCVGSCTTSHTRGYGWPVEVVFMGEHPQTLALQTYVTVTRHGARRLLSWVSANYMRTHMCQKQVSRAWASNYIP